MSTKTLLPKIAVLLTSSLVLTGCASGFSLYPPFGEESCLTEEGGQIRVPLDLQVSDTTPFGDDPFEINVFDKNFVFPGGNAKMDPSSIVVVEQAIGFHRDGDLLNLYPNGDDDVINPQRNPTFIGISPFGQDSDPFNPSDETVTALFQPLSTNSVDRSAWYLPTSSLGQKFMIEDDLDPEQLLTENLPLILPGIISVRCVHDDDAKGTFRAAKSIFPNYLDETGPLVFAPSEGVDRSVSDGPLTGTLRLPEEVPFANGLMAAYVFVDTPPVLDAPHEAFESVSGLWAKFMLSFEKQNLGQPGVVNLNLGDRIRDLTADSRFSGRAIEYSLSSRDSDGIETRPLPGSYLMLALLADQDVSNLKLKTSFFELTVPETGDAVTVRTFSDYGLEFGSDRKPVRTAAVAVAASVSPSITSVLPSNVSAAGGTKVTVKGSNLSGASVMVGDAPAALVSNTDGSIEFITPPSAAGKLGVTDLKLKTHAGSITAQGALTYEKAAVAPVTVVKPVLRKIQGFSGDSSAIISSHKAQLKRIGSEATKFTSATCVGYVGGGIRTASDRTLALNRAKAVCASLKSANPNLKVRISTDSTNFGFSAAARKVEIKLSR